ncbi:uncharacterized protein BDR25DRAFT_348622 [Lindgomyces ingoldianus]|uniref:Uncharacterized protein n=1 Tax=Lindgomyces ingoldianus TaxID=673940 RepID=A0ACB6RH22_9PLEO|nr:uncharacterized protein BDR25DRAFT_348622 [Lindgomyces ingoldianus]KAF2478365.1 hypothetical protein BDR25DRAFT_348622 [Lindgomyces ingoldianus]
MRFSCPRNFFATMASGITSQATSSHSGETECDTPLDSTLALSFQGYRIDMHVDAVNSLPTGIWQILSSTNRYPESRNFRNIDFVYCLPYPPK